MIVQDTSFTKSLARIVLVTALILSVPFLAMQITEGVAWALNDFVIMGALLFGTGLTYELIKRIIDPKYRLAVGITLIGIFLIIWAELAVGIFGTPFSGS